MKTRNRSVPILIAIALVGFLVVLTMSTVTAPTNVGSPNVAEAAAASWVVTGNSISSGNFLGTTNNKALELKVYNQRALKLVPGTNTTDGPNIIGGYKDNSVTSGAVGATIGGGGLSNNTNGVTDNYGTVGGGANNQAGNHTGGTTDALYATVGGGYSNNAKDDAATVSGGSNNDADGLYATIGGGSGNNATALDATVGGGAATTPLARRLPSPGVAVTRPVPPPTPPLAGATPTQPMALMLPSLEATTIERPAPIVSPRDAGLKPSTKAASSGATLPMPTSAARLTTNGVSAPAAGWSFSPAVISRPGPSWNQVPALGLRSATAM